MTMEEKIVKRCAEYAAHFAGLCDIACGVLDSAAQKFVAAEPGRRFCEDCALFPLRGAADPLVRLQ